MLDSAIAISRACVNCGYNLRGLIEPRCPECGVAFDPDELPRANIPWLHRATLGTWRAFWRTVFWVCLRPGELADFPPWESMIRAKDTRAFARICIAIAVASSVLCFSIAFGREPRWIWMSALTAPGQFLVLVFLSTTLSWSFPPWSAPSYHLSVVSRLTAAPLALSVFIVPLTLGARALWGEDSGVVPLFWIPLVLLIWLYVFARLQWRIYDLGTAAMNVLVLLFLWGIGVFVLGLLTLGVTMIIATLVAQSLGG